MDPGRKESFEISASIMYLHFGRVVEAERSCNVKL